MGSCLFKTFRWDLKWDVLFGTFEMLETFQTFKPITGVGYLKHSDKTWYEMCYLKFWNILTFSNSSWNLLIWNFQMRLQTRYSIWNFWNLKLLKHVMGVTYLKLSDETWQRGAICNFSNLKLFKPIMGSCLFETFRWDLKQDILFEMFETWNFSNMSWGVGYLKLSDEIWNEMCYMKLLKLETSQTCHGSCLFETFRWDLKQYILFDMFETWNFSNMSWELLIWNFQMRLEMRCAIWNFWNLKLFKHIMGCCLFETFRWDSKGDVLFKFWNILSFSNPSQELLIWNFQMRLETIYSIWYVWNLKLFKHVMGVAYLKLSDETWKRGAIWSFWNL